MAAHVAARRHGHGHRREQHGDQRGEVQEASCALHRGLDLRAGLGDVDESLCRLLGRLQLRLERAHRRGRPGEQDRVRRAAARLDQLRGRHVLQVHQQRGREVHEGRALVGAVGQHARHAEAGCTDADGIAHLRAEARQQAGVEPHLAPGGNVRRFLRRTEGLIGHLHAPAQRVAFADGPDGGQGGGLAEEHHGRKAERARGDQSPRARGLYIVVRWRVAGLQPEVGRDHLRGLLAHGLADTVGEEADAGEGRDRDDQRREQHGQLARAPVARQGHQREAQCLHLRPPAGRHRSRSRGRSAPPGRDRASPAPGSCRWPRSGRTAAARCARPSSCRGCL